MSSVTDGDAKRPSHRVGALEIAMPRIAADNGLAMHRAARTRDASDTFAAELLDNAVMRNVFGVHAGVLGETASFVVLVQN
jgi:hypothetical protein